MSIPFRRDYPFHYGVVAELTPLVRRIVARNPSPFTFHGTGSYIIGRGRVAVIDPGPALDSHVRALAAALRNETVTHLLVTHTHRDHSPACAALKAACGAPSCGYGPHAGGRWALGERVEEGADTDFVPDMQLRDGDIIEGPGWSLECVHTPGHTSNHMCYQLREERSLFTGDHVMAWSTTIVSPPDGNMGDYLQSLERLLGRNDARYWPTHGPPVDQPEAFVRALIAHRRHRETQVLACLEDGVQTIASLLPVVYRDLTPSMHPAAARSLFACLIHLLEQGRVQSIDPLGDTARFRLVR